MVNSDHFTLVMKKKTKKGRGKNRKTNKYGFFMNTHEIVKTHVVSAKGFFFVVQIYQLFKKKKEIKQTNKN
jgi:hypothetical protein